MPLEAAIAPRRLRPLRVLIVDDDEAVRNVLADVLAEEGMEIAGCAGNAIEGVSLALTHSPDIVILDFRMPGLNGIEAARQIRDGDASVRVVLLSAYDDPTLHERARAAGASAFLSKGCSLTLLLDAISDA
jgi:DNA-binding NarL/FixJ family response regulator